MAILFTAVLLGITIPIFSLVFGLLKPIITADNTGISMIIIALLIAIFDSYIGLEIFNRIRVWLEKRKR
jgi:hypothetical protein